MRSIRRLIHEAPVLFLWFAISAVIWGWVFSIMTDTSADKKLTVAIDAETKNVTELAVMIEEKLPQSIKMAKVYPFTYAMMNSSRLMNSDILIIPEHDMEEYEAWLQPVPEEFRQKYECSEYGIAINGLDDYIVKNSEEAFYICIGSNSLHPDEAMRIALVLLNM